VITYTFLAIIASLVVDGDTFIQLPFCVQDTVGDITIKGNTRTKKEAILAEILIKPGDPFTKETLGNINRRVMNLRFFESVKTTEEKQGSKYNITIEVKERQTWGISPIVEFRDGDDTYGIELSETNLMGNAKSISAFYERTGDDSSLGASFFDRHFMWSDFMVGVGVSTSESTTNWFDTTGNLLSTTERDTTVLSLTGGHWFNYQLRGFLTHSFRDDDYSLKSGTFLPVEGKTNKLSLSVQYFDVTYRLDRLEGPDLFAVYEKGHGGFSGDFKFYKYALGGRYYYTPQKDHTIIGKLAYGDGDDLPFHELFALGGAKTIRGYDSGQFQGSTYLLANFEYRVPVLRPRYMNYSGVLTWLAFVDSGYAWPESSSTSLSDIATGAGTGFRFYVDQFQAMSAGLDFAYGFEIDDWRIHLSFGTVF